VKRKKYEQEQHYTQKQHVHWLLNDQQENSSREKPHWVLEYLNHL
jgi:hypothetical protein